MIFVTVGSMLPFDRLIRIMDDWASSHPLDEVFCQIGDGAYLPKHATWSRILSGAEFKSKVENCDLLVAHAGTGSAFAAFSAKKPLVMVPRYAKLKEHTTDHQLHTAEWLDNKYNVIIAKIEDSIDDKIQRARKSTELHSAFSPFAPEEFTSKIRAALLKK